VKITEVEVRDVMKIKYVHVTPEGSMTVIGGKNAQGKTSFLSAIAMALGGEKLCPTKPIRNGKSSGVVKVTVDGDEAKGLPPSTVIRRFSLKEDGTVKSDMEIVSDSGYRAPKPQTLLNSVINNATFDPLYFASLQPKEQAENLRKLVGIDTSKQERQRAGVYETRRVVGQEMRKLEGHLKSLPPHDKSAPSAPVLASEVVAEMDAAAAVNAQHDEQRQALKTLETTKATGERALEDANNKIDVLEGELAAAKAEQKRIAAKLKQVSAEAQTQAACVAELQDVDLQPFRVRLDAVDKINAVVRQNQKRAEVELEHRQSKDRYEQLTVEIESIDAAVADLYQQAKWPIDGLGFDSDGVTYKGMPFTQCSDAEKLDVSVAMGFAMNPTLRMLVIRNGSLLDDDSLAHVAELAQQNDGQVFVERVGEGSECHLVLRDGEAVNAAEATED
jgi:predicted ATP-dependent endonuclease of OLD family